MSGNRLPMRLSPRSRTSIRTSRLGALVSGLVLGAGLMAPSAESSSSAPAVRPVVAGAEVPDVLRGDTWLRHHRDDLMPYWDMPEALGEPVGNFPSFRGRNGELLPETTNRGLATLARQVYGYSLAFMLTGEQRYLTYARAGLDWINTKAKDPVHGGYFGELRSDGEPVDPLAPKEVFDLASLGLAYGMYFNVTRDPAAEADLLAVRDLIFEKYYVPAQNRMRDALTFDLSAEVDTGRNGGDITNLLVPGTTISLPNAALLSDPARREQFRDDLRLLTDSLIARHKNSAAADPAERFWFWGRTLRFDRFGAPQTDFGHNIKSYEMIFNANNLFPDRPWDGLAADRTTLLQRAWDDPAARWNQELVDFAPGNAVPDSAWWIHDEADQTLAALDLAEEFAHQEQLARSAQSFLDVFVDRDPAYPARETFVRIDRTGLLTDLRKSHFGKNMLHNHEHALIMYLHGRALEGKPAKVYYAFPEAEALTAVAKPYWFDAAGESRTVAGSLDALPGHRVVEVEFTGIGAAARQPFPAPDDRAAPTSVADVSPAANEAGWHQDAVTISIAAADDLVGVKEIHAHIEERTGAVPDVAFIAPGDRLSLPVISKDGSYEVTYFAEDLIGNIEEAHTFTVNVDRTAPTVTGLPTDPCVIWPPDERMVHVADLAGHDALSGVASLRVTATADESADRDIEIAGGSVDVRATRDGGGTGRVYTVFATVTDRAGNLMEAQATCTVPHDLRRSVP